MSDTLEERQDAAAREITRHVPVFRESVAAALAQRVLQAAQVGQLQRQADAYRQALVRIADAESGVWGQIAWDALNEGDQ